MSTDTLSPSRPQLDPNRMQIARDHARENRRLMPLELAISVIYFVVWVAWVHIPLINWLERTFASTDLQVLCYVGLFGLGMTVINLPMDAYHHSRSVHYGLSVQTWRGWAIDLCKGLLIGVVLGLVVILVLYRLLAAYPDTWWLWMAGFYLLLTVLLAQLAPVLIMPLFLKFTPYEDEELTPRLQTLAEQAGTQVRGVFRTDLSSKTTAANAWLSGLGRTRRIVLGDTLLDHYSADEILSIFAHEMGHHVHRHLWRGILVSTLVSLVGFWLAGRVVSWAVEAYGYAGPADLRAFPWLILVLALFGILTSPLLNAFSRSQERAADRYALDHGPGAEPFVDAMTRLANQNLADPEPPRWQVLYSYSHPPILERIATAQHAGE
ncbi:MAG: M48 family metallopeptidase [Chloroflexi bacterium]|nr:M48 family metallopeptidase [Chloroflexota bacterium]